MLENTNSTLEAEEFGNSLTFLNNTGDVTITWDAENDEKIKDLVRSKMAQGYIFFTLRKVVIESIKVKRKIGEKGVDTITSLVIEDDEFDKLVKEMDDRDLATLMKDRTAHLAKRKGKSKEFTSAGIAKDPEAVVRGKQAIAVRPVVGG
jgi:hypothetical protein